MDRPVFLVGPPGSGTTLLRLMLDSHPDLMLARETGFLRSVEAIQNVPFVPEGDAWAARMGVTGEELDGAVRRLYDGLFSAGAARSGARRWGDKSPFHVYQMLEGARVFPDAQFVGIIRHPGACAASAGRRFGLGWNVAVRKWRERSAVMSAHGATLGDRFLLVRYEDLVTDQRTVIARVLEFLGIPWDDAVLAHHESHSGRQEGGTQAGDAVDSSRLGRWRASATKRQLTYLDRVSSDMSRLFGYDPNVVHPVRPLNPHDSGALSLGGVELGELTDELAVDLSRDEGRVGLENSVPTPGALAAELAAAYRRGQQGRPLRPKMRRFVPPEELSRRPVDRVRRRVARVVDPDRPA